LPIVFLKIQKIILSKDNAYNQKKTFLLLFKDKVYIMRHQVVKTCSNMTYLFH